MTAGRMHGVWTRLARRGLPVLALLLGCTGWLRAVDRFDVFLGFDTYVPEASWFPIVCEVENKGPLFSGLIEVSGGGVNEATTRTLPIELPSGTTKRVVLPVFFDGGYVSGWNVRLLGPKGRVEAEQLNLRARRQVRTESVLLGSISRNGVWAPSFQELRVRQDELAPAAARILPSLLADNPIALSGLDALYLNSEREVDLRLNQRDAIERWVRSGGHLIVGVETVSDVNSSPWLRALLPVRLSGVRTLQAHSQLQDWIRASVHPERRSRSAGGGADTGIGPPTPDRPFADLPDDVAFEAADLQVAVAEPAGGRVLVAVDNAPLIVQAAHGLGRVTVLTFSPEREPFRSWKSLPALWSRLTEVPPAWYASPEQPNIGRWASDGIFGAMIDSRQIRKLPVGWLLLLLVVYLVVIGPFDRWWLRKIGRPMLTWITFPLYVVFFSGMIYLIGYKLRAGEREWNELHVVDVMASVPEGGLCGRTYGSLYSPVNATYRLGGPQKVATLRGEAAHAWSGGGATESLDVIQREETFEAEAYVPVWTSQLYVSDWWMEGRAPVTVKLSSGPDRVTCELGNGGTRDLTHLRLVRGGRVYELGGLAAGENKRIELRLEDGRPLFQFVSQLGGMSYQNIVQQRGRAFGGATSGRIEDLPNGCFVASFLGALQSGEGRFMFAAPPRTELTPTLSDNAVLVAWEAGASPASPMNRFRASRGMNHTLWRVVIPLNP